MYATLYNRKMVIKTKYSTYLGQLRACTSLPTGRPLPKVSHILAYAGEREVKLLENWNIKYFA